MLGILKFLGGINCISPYSSLKIIDGFVDFYENADFYEGGFYSNLTILLAPYKMEFVTMSRFGQFVL